MPTFEFERLSRGGTIYRYLNIFVTSLPAEYGSVVDSLCVEVSVEVSKLDFVSRVRATFARISPNDDSLITDGKEKGKGEGKTGDASSTRVACSLMRLAQKKA